MIQLRATNAGLTDTSGGSVLCKESCPVPFPEKEVFRGNIFYSKSQDSNDLQTTAHTLGYLLLFFSNNAAQKLEVKKQSAWANCRTSRKVLFFCPPGDL